MEDAPRLLRSSGLLERPQFRRLFKSRHQETNKLEIRAKAALVVLRSDLTQHFTVYSVQIRSKVRWGDVGEWTLQKRYSEFAAFRAFLLQATRRWEKRCARHCTTKDGTAVVLISNALRRPISPEFPRKHMRVDNEAIVAERRAQLPAFVRQLLDTYADLVVYVHNNQPADQAAREELHVILDELEKFLDLPDKQRDVQRRQMAAVLALEDVDVEPNDADGQPVRTCCICLNDIEDDAGARGSALVQLPCQHHFHEDCVIDWYNTSITCPLCRDSCGTPSVMSDASDASTATLSASPPS